MMLEVLLQYLILLAVLAALVVLHHGSAPGSLMSPSAPADKAEGLVRARAPVELASPLHLLSPSLPPAATAATAATAPPPPPPPPLLSAWSPSRPITRISELQPSEIALLQFDSRYPLADYWLSAAEWNHYYCLKHGHAYIYYSLRSPGSCRHDPSGERLADPWCKVKAMLQASSEFPQVQLFVYLDSDAVIDKRFEDRSLVSMLSTMQEQLNWDLDARPVVFNQDGPCWWCKLVSSVGYSVCLNAGTVVWRRHVRSERVLRDWWAAAMDEQLEGNPLRRRFRLKWPWEQDRQMAVYNRTPEHIQIASQPGKPHMDMRAGHHSWCLSHLAQSGCFISHHCENQASKQRMMAIYDALRQPGAGAGAVSGKQREQAFKVGFLAVSKDSR